MAQAKPPAGRLTVDQLCAKLTLEEVQAIMGKNYQRREKGEQRVEFRIVQPCKVRIREYRRLYAVAADAVPHANIAACANPAPRRRAAVSQGENLQA